VTERLIQVSSSWAFQGLFSPSFYFSRHAFPFKKTTRFTVNQGNKKKAKEIKKQLNQILQPKSKTNRGEKKANKSKKRRKSEKN